MYDIAANTYKPGAPMPFPVLGVEFVVHGRALYGAGGEDRLRGRSARLLHGEIKDSTR